MRFRGFVYVKGLFGWLPSLAWLASASQAPFGQALCMQGVACLVTCMVELGWAETVFGCLHVIQHSNPRCRHVCLVGYIQVVPIISCMKW
jgi:hypothetical protein